MKKLITKGYAYTWGNSYFTILGHNTRTPFLQPTKVNQTHRVPGTHPLAGLMTMPYRNTVQELRGLFVKVATGPYHMAFVSETGVLYTCGETSYGKLGQSFNPLLPCKVPGLFGIVDAACGNDFTLALSSEGYVFSWGYGGEHKSFTYALTFKEDPGALGHGNFFNYDNPTLIEGLEDIIEIDAGYFHSIALHSQGEVYVWGSNNEGQLGTGTTALNKPTVLGLSNIKKVSAAANYSAAISHAGELFVWGESNYKQIGPQDRDTPTLLATGVSDIYAGEGGICMVKDGGVAVIGFNQYSEVTHKEIPDDVVSVVAGDEYAAALTFNGKVYALGGLFGNTKPSFWFNERGEEFEEAPRGFFDGRVTGLFGKYGYYAAIVL